MSWWTGFRDAALQGVGLKKGNTTAVAIGKAGRALVAGSKIKQAVVYTTLPQTTPLSQTPTAAGQGFSIATLTSNPLLIALMVGGVALYKSKK